MQINYQDTVINVSEEREYIPHNIISRIRGYIDIIMDLLPSPRRYQLYQHMFLPNPNKNPTREYSLTPKILSTLVSASCKTTLPSKKKNSFHHICCMPTGNVSISSA
jgi:hypothetical protein